MRFAGAVDESLSAIAAQPERFAVIDDLHRACPVGRFPFRIVYRVVANRIVVVAMAHAKRRPGYWKGRKLTWNKLLLFGSQLHDRYQHIGGVHDALLHCWPAIWVYPPLLFHCLKRTQIAYEEPLSGSRRKKYYDHRIVDDQGAVVGHIFGSSQVEDDPLKRTPRKCIWLIPEKVWTEKIQQYGKAQDK